MSCPKASSNGMTLTVRATIAIGTRRVTAAPNMAASSRTLATLPSRLVVHAVGAATAAAQTKCLTAWRSGTTQTARITTATGTRRSLDIAPSMAIIMPTTASRPNRPAALVVAATTRRTCSQRPHPCPSLAPALAVVKLASRMATVEPTCFADPTTRSAWTRRQNQLLDRTAMLAPGRQRSAVPGAAIGHSARLRRPWGGVDKETANCHGLSASRQAGSVLLG